MHRPQPKEKMDFPGSAVGGDPRCGRLRFVRRTCPGRGLGAGGVHDEHDGELDHDPACAHAGWSVDVILLGLLLVDFGHGERSGWWGVDFVLRGLLLVGFGDGERSGRWYVDLVLRGLLLVDFGRG